MPSKVNFHFTCQFKHVSPETDTATFRGAYFTSKPEILIDHQTYLLCLILWKKNYFKGFQISKKEESGWIFEYVVRFEINYALYEPHRGRSYIPLPRAIAVKKAVIN